MAPRRRAAAAKRAPVPAVLGMAAIAALDETTAIEDESAVVDDDAPLEQTRRAMQNSKPIIASGAAAVARKFDKPPRKGIERARVGYRRVRIGSEPVDVGSTELGRLDRGDEIEILESHEGFLRVRTPDHITGWIPRQTILGTPSS